MNAMGAVHVHQRVVLESSDDFEAWRDVARLLVMARMPPHEVSWCEPGGTTGDLFGGEDGTRAVPVGAPAPAVSRAYLDLAGKAMLHSDPRRFDLLYRLLWRLQSDRSLMEDGADPDVRQISLLAREVRRDIHKMRAFVRFRAVADGEGDERFVAWFEPMHHILRANAAFFVNRFTTMTWSILTPRGTLHWDGTLLREGPPARREDAPAGDPVEALWQDYYASIFNPARLKIGAMLKEMPRRYWKNMPETALIPDLVAGARARELAMVDAGTDLFADAEHPTDLDMVAKEIAQCRRCAIGCNGTRAVTGEGDPQSRLMIVGEQPGDVEETEGRPFVGPAGQLLMAHMDEVGIDRTQAYVTNAVKHFKYSPRGKRRIHETPNAREIDICRWWLDSERGIVKPKLILALGASAARGVLGKTVSVQKERGRAHSLPDGGELWITTHPSYLLRVPEDKRGPETERFVDDLRAVRSRLEQI